MLVAEKNDLVQTSEPPTSTVILAQSDYQAQSGQFVKMISKNHKGYSILHIYEDSELHHQCIYYTCVTGISVGMKMDSFKAVEAASRRAVIRDSTSSPPDVLCPVEPPRTTSAPSSRRSGANNYNHGWSSTTLKPLTTDFLLKDYIIVNTVALNEGASMPNTEELRSQIEAIDEQIIDLIATRMEIADELAKAKKKSSEQYWDEEKEHEVVKRYHELCEEVSLSETEADQIAEVILNISKERQKHYFE